MVASSTNNIPAGHMVLLYRVTDFDNFSESNVSLIDILETGKSSPVFSLRNTDRLYIIGINSDGISARIKIDLKDFEPKPENINECPMTYDPSLDDNPNPGTDPGYTYESYIINIQDKDGDGNFEDRIFCLYYGSGQLSRDQIYVDDIRNTLKTYFESGQLKSESPKVDGLLHGIAVGYFETGQLQYERPYDHGMRHEIHTWYYESGVLEREDPYVNDKMDGRLKIYASNGKMTSCYIYENGTKIGDCMP